jgi:hypothetical protein
MFLHLLNFKLTPSLVKQDDVRIFSRGQEFPMNLFLRILVWRVTLECVS